MKRILFFIIIIFIFNNYLKGEVIIPEFKVNDIPDTTYMKDIQRIFYKSSPSVFYKNNKLTCFWFDDRNFLNNKNIYTQKYENLIPEGKNKIVNSNTPGGIEVVYYNVSSNDSLVLLVWGEQDFYQRGKRSGLFRIIYDKEGNVLKEEKQIGPWKVSSAFTITNNQIGNDKICFAGYNSSTHEILLWNTDLDGNPVDDTIKLQFDKNAYPSTNAIAINEENNIMISIFTFNYIDNISTSEIYYIDDKNRTPEKIFYSEWSSEDSLIYMVEDVNITSDKKFLVMYNEFIRNPETGYYKEAKLFGQLYNSDGSKKGEEKKLLYYPGEIFNSLTFASFNGNNILLYKKFHDREDTLGIWAKTFDNLLNTKKGPSKLMDITPNGPTSKNGITFDDDNNFYFIWTEKDDNIYIKKFSLYNLTPISDKIKVNDDTLWLSEMEPRCAIDENNNFLITWNIKEKDNSIIYFYNKDGELIKKDTLKTFKATAQNKNNFLTLYSTSSDSSEYIRYRITGEQLAKYKIGFVDRLSQSNIALSDNDNFVSLYGTSVGWTEDLRAQIISKNNEKIGDEIIIHPHVEYVDNDLVINDDGSFYVTYSPAYPGMPITWWFALYDSTGNFIDSVLISKEAGEEIYHCDPATDGENLIVSFMYKSNPTGGIGFRIFDKNGNLIKEKIVTKHIYAFEPTLISTYYTEINTLVNRKDSLIVLVWTEWDDDYPSPYVAAMKFDFNGNQITDKQRIVGPDEFTANSHIIFKGAAANDERIVFAWMDNRDHQGWDVYAKVTDWDLIYGIEENKEKTNIYIKNKFIKDKIVFSTKTSKEYNASIYNITGAKIKECRLKDNTIDVKNLSKGIYFLIIKDEKEKTIWKDKVIKIE